MRVTHNLAEYVEGQYPTIGASGGSYLFHDSKSYYPLPNQCRQIIKPSRGISIPRYDDTGYKLICRVWKLLLWGSLCTLLWWLVGMV